jgi:signal peptidase I
LVSETKHITRTDRRLLERKQRNKVKKEETRSKNPEHNQELPKTQKATARLFKIRDRLVRSLYPKLPGGINIRRPHLISLGYRLPFFLALCYLLTNDDIAPYVIQGSIGPSMLPTIQFIGDLWLVETGAWYRFLGWHPALKVGDVVLWKDPTTQRVSCKRIVGMEGDKIRRYGQYVHLYYPNREDMAIVWPSDAKERNLDIDCSWDDTAKNELNNPFRTMMVPPGHVWLEGDCPPFSLDSRQHGPIPISLIRGRLVLRLWPMQREDGMNGSLISCWVNRDRPVPFASVDDYLGKRFNFYRIPKEQASEE